MMQIGFLLYFVVIAFIGIDHGFPLLNHFADEMYYAWGTAEAISKGSFVPHYTPYGVITFYATYILQIMTFGIIYILNHADITQAKTMIFANPYMLYFAPRFVNAIAYIAMCVVAMKKVKDEDVWKKIMVFTSLTSLVLVLFAHSGKMWVLSAVFLFMAMLEWNHKNRYVPIIWSSLALANFPLMGIGWAVILLATAIRERSVKSLAKMYAVALIIPVGIHALNYEWFVWQIRDLIFGYMEPAYAKSDQNFLGTYLNTSWINAKKILMTMPLLIALSCLSVKRVKEKGQCLVVGGFLVVYIAVLNALAYTAELGIYLRYLIPIPLCFTILFVVSEVRKSMLSKIVISCAGLISIYTSVVLVLNLSGETTYQEMEKLLSDDFIYLSYDSAMNTSINKKNAKIIQDLLPEKCHVLCNQAIELGVEGERSVLIVRSREDLNELEVLQKRVAEIVSENKLPPAEFMMGSYFEKNTWLLTRLGPKLKVVNEEL